MPDPGRLLASATSRAYPALQRSVLAVLASIAAGGLLIALAGSNPLEAYANLLRAGFGCRGPGPYCAVFTALTFSVPLLLSGLAATVALRAGFFSLGQAGQILWGAGIACWIGANLRLPAGLHPLAALGGGALAGAVWSGVPAVLRERLGVSEIVVTLLMNPLAGMLLRPLWLPRILATAQLPPLIGGTKLTAGLFIAWLAALGVYILLWHTTWGYEQRVTGLSQRFALFGGLPRYRPVVRAGLISGALAGLAGGIEVLGVHYGFVTSFSAADNFDGLVVAFAGQLHPAGVFVFAFLLGGLRAGAIVGLQIQSGVPREIGGLLIALILIFASIGLAARRQDPARAGSPEH